MKFSILVGVVLIMAMSHLSALIKVGDAIPSFVLYNQDNKQVTEKDLLGKVIVLNFIFTRCGVPTMCPASMHKMGELQNLVRDNYLCNNILFVTISFDSEFDTPAVLKKYAEAYKINLANYFLLTGDEEVIKRLTSLFGVYIISQQGLQNHTMRTLVIDKQGKVIYSHSKADWQPKALLQIIKKTLHL